MITLILNATEARVQFVIAQSEELTATRASTILLAQDIAAPSRGTELLPPALNEALVSLELSPMDVRRVACVSGPGSFTGLRLVLSFAAALRRATGAQLAGLNYLQAIAASLPLIPGMPPRCRVLTHARRDLVHVQDFSLPCVDSCDNAQQASALPEQALPTAEGFYATPSMVELTDALGHLEAPALLVGSGLDRNYATLHRAALNAGFFPLYNAGYPSATGLLRLTQEAKWVSDDLAPLYLRPCDAVDNLPHIARKRGEDPDTVVAKLHELLQ